MKWQEKIDFNKWTQAQGTIYQSFMCVLTQFKCLLGVDHVTFKEGRGIWKNILQAYLYQKKLMHTTTAKKFHAPQSTKNKHATQEKISCTSMSQVNKIPNPHNPTLKSQLVQFLCTMYKTQWVSITNN